MLNVCLICSALLIVKVIFLFILCVSTILVNKYDQKLTNTISSLNLKFISLTIFLNLSAGIQRENDSQRMWLQPTPSPGAAASTTINSKTRATMNFDLYSHSRDDRVEDGDDVTARAFHSIVATRSLASIECLPVVQFRAVRVVKNRFCFL